MEASEYLHNHLLASEKGVADEFAGAQGDGLLFVGHGCGLPSISVSAIESAIHTVSYCRRLRAVGRWL